jgi:hypothetical protein
MRLWLIACLFHLGCAAAPPPEEKDEPPPPQPGLPVDSDDLCTVHCERAEKCGVFRDACERDCPARGRAIGKMRRDYVGNLMLCLEGASCNGLKEGTAWDGCHTALVKGLPVSDTLRRFCFESSRRAAQCKRADDVDQIACLLRFRLNNDTALEQARTCFAKPCGDVPGCMAKALMR